MKTSHNMLKAFAAVAFAYAGYGLAAPAGLAADDVYVCCNNENDCAPSQTGWFCYDFGVDCQEYEHIGGGNYFCAYWS